MRDFFSSTIRSRPGGYNAPIVRAAQTIIAGTLPECDTIETSTFELLPDRIHFAASGLMQMGRRFAAPGWL